MLCKFCNIDFVPKRHNQLYCTVKCKNKQKAKKAWCNKDTMKNTCGICGSPCRNRYCSQTCVGKSHKKPNNYYCQGCDVLISVYWTGRKFCKDCAKSERNHNYKDWSSTTVGQLKARIKNNHQFNSRIRSLARTIYFRNNSEIKCNKCGYDKHTNICHIKAVCTFDDNTLISVVNDMSNLTQLCPNCHWELDHPK